MFNFQQQVVRELDFKKPQLDELVHLAENIKKDASRQQLQTKGSYNSPTDITQIKETLLIIAEN